MMSAFGKLGLYSLVFLLILTVGQFVWADSNSISDINDDGVSKPSQLRFSKAAVIQCSGMIDDGLYKSIRRRASLAMADGADYLIFSISTYGGLVKSADDISKYFILELSKKVHTVAYVKTEAISAGAMISVSCQDIIMAEHTNIGDCAPIIMGQKLEGVEREKAESFIRATFARAAQANNYPELLLRAMVTNTLEVYRLKNLQTGQYKFFDGQYLPTDPDEYDLIDTGPPISKAGQLLTLTASQAKDLGLARAVVKDIDEAVVFLADRDGVKFDTNLRHYKMLWSEEMVRWLNSPAVTGILFMFGLLGIYVEFKTPGLGLAGLVAVICFTVLFGSKFLVDLANWFEIAVLVTGLVLMAIEIFVIPGFGVAGILGILCIVVGFLGMLVKNPPGQLPIPRTTVDWYYFKTGVIGLSVGFLGFISLAWLLAKYLPKVKFLSPLALEPYSKGKDKLPVVMTGPSDNTENSLAIGDTGIVVSKLRPAGKAAFEDVLVDVVCDGEFLENGQKVEIIEIAGNKVVVKKITDREE